jgi:predicted nucleic acid-binding protein
MPKVYRMFVAMPALPALKSAPVIRPSKTEEKEAVQLLTNHRDKLWSLVDALSFTIMEKLTIPYYFSFDEDFRQTGKFVDVTRYL